MGAFTVVGRAGYGWSTDVNVYFLYFYPNNIYIAGPGCRAYGLQVRCLRE